MKLSLVTDPTEKCVGWKSSPPSFTRAGWVGWSKRAVAWLWSLVLCAKMANDRIESLVITSGHCTWYKIKGDSIYIYNKLERDIIIYIERKGNDRVRTCIMRVSCLSQTYLTVDMQPHLSMNSIAFVFAFAVACRFGFVLVLYCTVLYCMCVCVYVMPMCVCVRIACMHACMYVSRPFILPICRCPCDILVAKFSRTGWFYYT